MFSNKFLKNILRTPIDRFILIHLRNNCSNLLNTRIPLFAYLYHIETSLWFFCKSIDSFMYDKDLHHKVSFKKKEHSRKSESELIMESISCFLILSLLSRLVFLAFSKPSCSNKQKNKHYNTNILYKQKIAMCDIVLKPILLYMIKGCKSTPSLLFLQNSF